MDSKLVSFLKKRKINVLTDEDTRKDILVWQSWYKGKVDKFHTYKVYTGTNSITKERATLNMAPRACQRWADLLLNEKVEINVNVSDEDKSGINEFVSETLRKANFRKRANNLLELAFGIGGGFFIEYWDGKKPNIKYISQEYMLPITFDSGKLIECAFASKKQIKNKPHYYIELHMLDKKNEYVIKNIIVEIKDDDLKEVDAAMYGELEVEREIKTLSQEPLFQSIMPNVSNRRDFNSAYGVSVFNGAVDILKTLDIIYDSYRNEFLLGKKRIFVGDSITNVHHDEKGNVVKVFDPHDEIFYKLPDDEGGERIPITESNMEYRVEPIDKAIQTNLNLFSQSVGFGSDGFSWENGAVKTATEVVSENSEMFRTLKKHEIIVRDAIIGAVRGLIVINNRFSTKKYDANVDISVLFDDSIIEDKESQQRQATLELNLGLISAIQYYQDVYGMTQKQADEYFKKMQKEIAATTPNDGEEPPEGA